MKAQIYPKKIEESVHRVLCHNLDRKFWIYMICCKALDNGSDCHRLFGQKQVMWR